MDTKKLRETAEAVATRNRSVKRGHPKYTANVTSAEEAALTDGILALLDENDSLRAEVERLRDDNARLLVAKLPTSEDYDRIVKQLAAARAEIERLKRDVELNHILGEGTWVPEEALTIAERNLAATRAALKKAIGIAEQLVRHHGDYFNCRYRLSELSMVARDD